MAPNKRCVPAIVFFVSATTLAAVLGCRARTEDVSDTPKSIKTEPRTISSLGELVPLVSPCIAKDSKTATFLRVVPDANGSSVAKSCYGEGHDRVCLERVLRAVRITPDAQTTSLIIAIDKGVITVSDSSVAASGLVFGGAGYADDNCVGLQ